MQYFGEQCLHKEGTTMKQIDVKHQKMDGKSIHFDSPNHLTDEMPVIIVDYLWSEGDHTRKCRGNDVDQNPGGI